MTTNITSPKIESLFIELNNVRIQIRKAERFSNEYYDLKDKANKIEGAIVSERYEIRKSLANK